MNDEFRRETTPFSVEGVIHSLYKVVLDRSADQETLAIRRHHPLDYVHLMAELIGSPEFAHRWGEIADMVDLDLREGSGADGVAGTTDENLGLRLQSIEALLIASIQRAERENHRTVTRIERLETELDKQVGIFQADLNEMRQKFDELGRSYKDFIKAELASVIKLDHQARISKDQLALNARLLSIEKKLESSSAEKELHSVLEAKLALNTRLLSIEEKLESSSAEKELHSVLEAQLDLNARLLSIEEKLERSSAEKESHSVLEAQRVEAGNTVNVKNTHVLLEKGPYGSFLVFKPDLIGGAVGRGEFWDPHLKEIFDRYADNTKTAVDVGAYIGFHSVYLASKFERLISFEPQVECYRMIISNQTLNDCRNMSAFNLALYDHPTCLSIADGNMQQIELRSVDGSIDYGSIGNAAALTFAERVGTGMNLIEARTLDSFQLENVGFIKIDAQGSDLRVLQGACATINRCRPVITFEFEKQLSLIHNSTLEDYHNFFESIGYRLEQIAHTGPDQWDFVAHPL